MKKILKVTGIIYLILLIIGIFQLINYYSLREKSFKLETSVDFCSRELFSDQLTYLLNEQIIYSDVNEKNAYDDVVNKDAENTFKKYFESKGWDYSIRIDRDGKDTVFIELNKDNSNIRIEGERNNLESTIFKEYFVVDSINIYPDEDSEYDTFYTSANTFDFDNDTLDNIFNEKYQLKDYIEKMVKQREEYNDIILDEQRSLNDDEYEIIKQQAEAFNNFIEDYKIFLNNKC